MWRPEDEALLERLEHEALLGAVWTATTGDAGDPPPPRAAGLLQCVSELSAGGEALASARLGDLGPLLSLLRPRDLGPLRPAFLHHLALFWARVGWHLEPESVETRDARLRALAAWLALGTKPPYLRELANAVVGDALPEAEVHRLSDDAPLRLLETLGRSGREGAAERSPEARLSLRVLGAVDEAIALAGAEEHALGKRARSHASRLREQILDAALRNLEDALGDASARAEPGDEHVQLFARATETWRWADQDAFVERFIVQRAVPICWELYTGKRWPLLRLLSTHVTAPVDRLAARVEADPAELAYAAPTAQMLVFRAELDYRFEAQLAYAERAVRVCETHRNGRLVCADLLAERALRTLHRAPVFGRASARERARQDVLRARSLWPSVRRLQDAEAALLREGIEIDA